jgi:hypothetical protein
MDIRRTGPAGMRISLPPYRDRPASARSSSRSNSQTSDDSCRPYQAMVIPGSRHEDVPPPLPPPRYNDDLAHGVDIAWKWANNHPFDHRQLAPIKAGSSLHGSFIDSAGRLSVGQEDDDDDKDDMDIDDDDYARTSGHLPTVRAPPYPERRVVAPIAGLTRSPPSPLLGSQR